LAVPGIAFLLPLSSFSSGLASNGTEATATSIVSSAASVPPACLVRLVAKDASDRTLFESVAAATATPGLAVAPLHPLERGGVQWRSLDILKDDAGSGAPPPWDVTAVATIDRDRDQVLLQVPDLPACAGRDTALAQAISPVPAGRFDSGPSSAGSGLAPGSAVLLARGRDGFRNRLIGGRVERVVNLPGERRMLLVRLLDERGADPGLLFDPTGTLLGSVLPSPAGGDPSLATVVLQPNQTAPDAPPPRDVREAIAASASPSVLGTVPGLVSQALRLSGPARFDRALALLDAASRQAGMTASLLLEKGVLEFGAGRVASAVEDFRQAAGIDPASHLARYNLGIALGTEGRYQDAAAALQSARDLEPRHGRTHFQLALALRAMGRTEEARRELDSLSQIDPVLAGELKVILGA
jgi:hypothetical protein